MNDRPAAPNERAAHDAGTPHAHTASIGEVKASHPSLALGLSLTNECNLACVFCYRDPPPRIG
jgi:MoaA/NifB/PqqE/SkfB family radical SAM enzyme